MKLKLLMLSLFLIVIASVELQTNAQNQVENASDGDSLLISKLVNQQINDAVAKQNQPAKTISVPAKKKLVLPVTVTENKASLFESFSSVNIKLLILAVATLMAIGFVFFRRRMMSLTTRKISSYKDTINLLRIERIRVKTSNRMKSIRGNLITSSKSNSQHEQYVTKKARELNVSREEILLASKLREHQLVKQ
jgi:hypothetical protein